MGAVIALPLAGYRYLSGVFQYSAGVAAEPGFQIERARFRHPVPLDEGFRAIPGHLRAIGRPLAALCACELRSPAPFSEEGFAAFNRLYVGTLARWEIVRNEANPVARSNVCPAVDPPASPSFHAFAYTLPAHVETRPNFQIAGSGEAPEGKGSYQAHIIRRGDTSPGGLREKARYVLGEMERRMRALGVGWAEATATQLYTVHDVHPILAEEIVRRGAASGGLTWHFARPPVVGIDFEMDVRGVAREIVL
ncbi:MAG TPA: hypothetical protein VLT62_09505 [Candidatus Methylomirabilis sp.]|nr:hypothetical protein [Candidatus Methylomirabilis sp.]